MSDTTIPIPKSNGILLLGIFSLITGVFCAGIVVVGFILGVMATLRAKEAKLIYLQNPDAYSQKSFKNVEAGRIMGIIGLIINSLIVVILFIILVLSAAVVALLQDFFSGGHM